MRFMTIVLFGVLVAGCGENQGSSNIASADNGSNATQNNDNTSVPRGWWIEIEGSGLAREDLSGTTVLASTGTPSSIRGDHRDFEASISFVMSDDLSVPGTYTSETVQMYDRLEPEHYCVAGGLTVEVLSSEPWEANLSGMARCWEGDRIGDAEDAIGGALTGYIRE